VYLTTSVNGTTLGAYPTTPGSEERLRVYPVKNPATGLAELRTQGGPGEGNTLAVVGAHGLLDFASLEDPAAVPVPEGGKCDWTSFRLDDDEQEGDGVLRYAAGDGGDWVAFPDEVAKGGWSVKWKGGEFFFFF
jgi:hypothetical protein